MCPSASCLVLTVLFHSFCFFFLGGGGGGERGGQVRVMDSLVLSFGVFLWSFGGFLEEGLRGVGNKRREDMGEGRG